MATFGITKIAGALIESVDVTLTTDVKQLINANGTHGGARIVDAQYAFSVKGKGDMPQVGLGGNTGDPEPVSGKVIITKISEIQSNEDFQGFSYEGVGYVFASTGT